MFVLRLFMTGRDIVLECMQILFSSMSGTLIVCASLCVCKEKKMALLSL